MKLLSILAAGLAASGLAAAAPAAPAATYQNPLPVRLANGDLAQNCADPAVLRDPRAAVPTWYLYCTSDPVSKTERPAEGETGPWHFHMIAIYRSTDLAGMYLDGDRVTAWPERFGSDVATAVPGQPPVYRALSADFNGHPTVRFDNSVYRRSTRPACTPT